MVALQKPGSISLDASTRSLLEQVTVSIEELNQLRPFSSEIASRVRTSLLPDRIVASLNMEGIIATRRQTLAVMDALRISESVGRAELEIANTLRADEYVHDAVERGDRLSERFIRQINHLLLDGIRDDAGAFRAGNVELPGAAFEPPLPTEVPPLVEQLCEFYPTGESVHPILHAAWVHAQFTLIHPFSDGNGRTGRLLQDYTLVRRGLLPVGIPPSERDDYYAALERADRGDWNDLAEMIGLLQLTMVTKTLAIAREPQQRASWIERLSKAASQKEENTLHKQYLVWRKRMEQISQTFAQSARELDASSNVIGAECRDFGVVDFPEWRTICQRGYTERSWLFSLLLFAEGQPFYKTVAFLRRHIVRPEADPFTGERDLVALYFTGGDPRDHVRHDMRDYLDPHIRLREIVYVGDTLHKYTQANPEAGWSCETDTTIEAIVEEFFTDVFVRKAGIAA